MMVTMGMLVTDLSKGSQIKNRSSRPQTFHKNLSSRDTVMLVTKMTITVTNILYLSPTHFVSNIRHQHRSNQFLLKVVMMLDFADGPTQMVKLSPT